MMRTITITAALLVAAACGTDRSVPQLLQQSQVVLATPPSWANKGHLEDNWEWSTRADENMVLLVNPQTGVLDEFYITGQDQVLMCATWELSGTLYLLVGVLDASEEFSLLRYHDSTGDGRPDASTEAVVFDAGTNAIYPTHLCRENRTGSSIYLLDSRCADILYVEDTNSDGWPDTIQTTPFARSSDHPELLDVYRLRSPAVGVVEAHDSYIPSSAVHAQAWELLELPFDRYSDTNSDNVADVLAVVVPVAAHPAMLGIPYDGQTAIDVSGVQNAGVQVWTLNVDMTQDTLIGSGTIGAGITSITLTSALTKGDRVGVYYATGSTGRDVPAYLAVDDWPQITEVDEPLIDIAGGTHTIKGLNFASDVDVGLVTKTGTHNLSFTFVDSRTLTVTVPALTTDDVGAAWLRITAPSQPDDEIIGAQNVPVCD